MSECLTKNVETKFVRDLKGKSLSMDEFRRICEDFYIKQLKRCSHYSQSSQEYLNNMAYEILKNTINLYCEPIEFGIENVCAKYFSGKDKNL